MSNTIEVEGLLGGDPELRYSGDGLAIATFNLADSPRKWNKETKTFEDAGETAWYRVSVLGNQAETVAAQYKKGQPVMVKGPLTFRTWEDKDGKQRESKEIKADKTYPVLRGTRSGNPTTADNTTAPAKTAVNDEESPF